MRLSLIMPETAGHQIPAGLKVAGICGKIMHATGRTPATGTTGLGNRHGHQILAPKRKRGDTATQTTANTPSLALWG
jgi:hypothetical protein